MKINKIIAYSFSSLSKCYDLITIGSYANRVAKTVAENAKQRLSILTVQEENTIVEPSLVSTGSPVIQIEQYNNEFSDMERGVGVREINPNRSYLVLKNGNKYHYRQLVYSGNPTDWKGENPNLVSKSKQSQFLLYDDFEYTNIQQLYFPRAGSLVFVVPKQRHFGFQNYLMMLLQSRIAQKKIKHDLQQDSTQITVICEGSSLSPFNDAYSNLLEQLLKERSIKLIKNAQYMVDYKTKLIKFKSNEQLKFSSIFQYLPLQVPKVLTQAQINPFETNKHTLNHEKYENIHILGNVFNHIYSFSALNEMTKIMAQNIWFNSIGIRKRALYQGFSTFNLWLNDEECMNFKTDYNSNTFKKVYGESKFMRHLTAIYHKSSLQLRVNEAINSNAYSFFSFSKPQIINTYTSKVPDMATKADKKLSQI